MTKPIPEHIKKCFIYRKFHKDIWFRKKNVGIIVTGATGSGKSWFALKLASDLDPTFNVERVVYNTEDFLKLLVEGDSLGKLRPGQAIVFDETSHDEAMDSRSSLSEKNKQMAALSTIYRAMRLVVIYVAPNLNQIDSRVRAVSITALFEMMGIDYENKKSKARISWVVQNARTGDVYHKRPKMISPNRHIAIINSVSFAPPSKELVSAYEKKKMAFIKDKLKRWYETTKKKEEKVKPKVKNEIEITADVLRNKALFQEGGKISAFKIMEGFGISLSKASTIAAHIKRSN
jgi:hypothetical protein